MIEQTRALWCYGTAATASNWIQFGLRGQEGLTTEHDRKRAMMMESLFVFRLGWVLPSGVVHRLLIS